MCRVSQKERWTWKGRHFRFRFLLAALVLLILLPVIVGVLLNQYRSLRVNTPFQNETPTITGDKNSKTNAVNEKKIQKWRLFNKKNTSSWKQISSSIRKHLNSIHVHFQNDILTKLYISKCFFWKAFENVYRVYFYRRRRAFINNHIGRVRAHTGTNNHCNDPSLSYSNIINNESMNR